MKPTHPTDIAWQEILTVALLGTQRRPFQIPSLDGKLGAAMAETALQEGETETALMRAAAITALYRRAGQLPVSDSLPDIPDCPVDDLPRCSALIGKYLEQILTSGRVHLLGEWAGLAAQAGIRIREEHLSSLLRQPKMVLPLRDALLPVLGKRGHWLARQNPDWTAYAPVVDEHIWQDGRRKLRLVFLKDLRLRDPQAARELLERNWNREVPADRAAFLDALSGGLSMADEPFLESVLSERRKDVRQASASLLRRLPDSRLVQRMIARGREWVTWKTGLLRSAIDVRPPGCWEADMARDGIEEKPPTQLSMGEKIWWLAQTLSAIPPKFWTGRWGKRPAAILEVARKHEWENALIYGWMEAALAFNDNDWLDELFLYKTQQSDSQSLFDFFKRLPDSRKDPVMVALLHDHPDLAYDHPASIWLSTCQFLWSEELTQQATNIICWTLKRGDMQPWRWQALLCEIGMYFHPESMADSIANISNAQISREPKDPFVNNLLAMLEFRHEMHCAFAEVTQ